MSNISLQIANMISVINNLTPYSHNGSYPFNNAYHNVELFKLSTSNVEDVFRHYIIKIHDCNPLPVSSTVTQSFSVDLSVEVLYPFSKQNNLASKYFSEENNALKTSLESPDNFVNANVRLVNLENSRITQLDDTKIIFEYDFNIIVNESL